MKLPNRGLKWLPVRLRMLSGVVRARRTAVSVQVAAVSVAEMGFAPHVFVIVAKLL